MNNTEQDFQQGFEDGSFFAGWFKTASDLMLSASQFWFSGNASESSSSENIENFNIQEFFASLAQAGQTVFNSWKDNESAQEAINDLNKLSEAILTMARSGMNNHFKMQQDFLNGLGNAGESFENFHINNIPDNPFNAFLQDYEKFFSKYLNMPKLGLLRYYEEKRDKAIDKYNLMLASVGEFFYLLYIPLAKSITVMQKQFDEMSKNGQLSDNPKDYYKRWIKILEGDYLSLFRTQEFLKTAHRALNTFEDFNFELQNLSNDILQYTPLPSQREMDDLAQENYKMKKQMRGLMKRIENLESEQATA